MGKKLRNFLRKLGPGIITGASDDDPSGIGTYSATGAQFGFKQIWTPLYTLPLMIAVQEMCARIGLVTGRGLASVIRKYYSKKLLYFCVFLLVIANTVNIGADLGVMAAVTNLLWPKISFVLAAIGFTIAIVLLEIFVSYKTYAKFLRILVLSLFAYWLVAIFVEVNWGEVFKNLLIPAWSFNKDYLFVLVGVLGTTISPYLFFWQASEEVEEKIEQGRNSIASRQGATLAEITDMRQDTFIGMIFSNVSTFFIILAAGATLYVSGIHNITSAAEAAEALRPLAGNAAYFLFSLGILGTGLLAIPVLAGSAAYGVSETLKLHEGLGLKWKQAHGFYSIIALSIIVGLLMNFIGINPITALIWAAVLNGVIAVPLIAIIIFISNNKKIMGEHKNGNLANIFGWLCFVLMAGAAILMFWSILA